MDEDSMVYLVFSIIVLVIASAMLPSFGKGIYMWIAATLLALTFIFILAMNWSDFIIMPALTSLFGITFTPSRNYLINKHQNAVLKNVNGLFYATGYLTANLFSYTFKEENAPEEDELKLSQAPETWERAVMSLQFPYKFHVLSSGMDVQKVRDELEGKRSFQEFQLSRAMQGGANEMTIADLQRKANVLQAKMNRISQGEKPIATLMYVETTAIGVTEKAATDALDTQLRALQIGLSSQDVQLTRIAGRELYTLFTYGFSIPTSFSEIAGMFDQQG
jgi:hypothetical protein